MSPSLSMLPLRILIALTLALLHGVSTQMTDAVCEAGFGWSYNSRGQSPCLIAAYMYSACEPDPSDAQIPVLTPGDHYSIPMTSVSPCFCNTVFYSVLGACAFCQGDENTPWVTFSYNCTSINVGQFPEPIPTGTAIPAWAYLDVTQSGTFNVTVAQAFSSQDHAESSAIAAPTSSMSTSLPSTSLYSSFTPDPNSPLTSSTTLPADGKNARSNVGPIVGGVIGGVGGVAILGAAFLLFLRHRRDSNKIAPSALHHAVSHEAPWFPSIEKSHMSQTIPTQPQDFSMNLAKLYNPDDPSTFPSALNTATAIAPPAGNNTLDGSFTVHNDSHYSGTPEL